MEDEIKKKFVELCKELPECRRDFDLERLKRDKRLAQKLKEAIG